MAIIPLYCLKSYVRGPRWAKFPQDFDEVAQTLVDDQIACHPRIRNYRWNLKPKSKKSLSGRAWRHEGTGDARSTFYMHREIWEVANGPIPDGLTIDHKNMDALDNRLDNLRLATQSQQIWNRKSQRSSAYPYKGVTFLKAVAGQPKPFHGYISPPDYPVFCLGYYENAELAGFAYNCAAPLLYGEFARLNEIPEGAIPPARQEEIRRSVMSKLIKRGLIPSPETSCNRS